VQAQIDELTELAEVGPGTGGPAGQDSGTLPGLGGADDEPEPEPVPPAAGKKP
jgi:hypothetical protein